MNLSKQKEIIFSVAMAIEFLALSNGNGFWPVFIIIFATIIFSVITTIGIKAKKSDVLENIHFFILPILYFLGFVFFLPIIQIRFLQLLLVGGFVLSNFFLLRSIEKLCVRREKPLLISKNIISMIGLVTIFFVLTDISNLVIFYSLPVYLHMALVFAVTWAITYFLYWQYRDIDKDSVLFISLTAFIMAEISWAGSFWVTSYPSYEIGSLGVPVFDLTSVVIYYAYWGIAHHQLKENLTKKILLEYIMISLIIISIILFTTKWIPGGII